jgi:hypothetical protein
MSYQRGTIFVDINAAYGGAPHAHAERSIIAKAAIDAPPFSFMPANTALRCHNNKADRSSLACDDGVVGRHL